MLYSWIEMISGQWEEKSLLILVQSVLCCQQTKLEYYSKICGILGGSECFSEFLSLNRTQSCSLWRMELWSHSCVKIMKTMKMSISNWIKCKYFTPHHLDFLYFVIGVNTLLFSLSGVKWYGFEVISRRIRGTMGIFFTMRLPWVWDSVVETIAQAENIIAFKECRDLEDGMELGNTLQNGSDTMSQVIAFVSYNILLVNGKPFSVSETASVVGTNCQRITKSTIFKLLPNYIISHSLFLISGFKSMDADFHVTLN